PRYRPARRARRSSCRRDQGQQSIGNVLHGWHVSPGPQLAAGAEDDIEPPAAPGQLHDIYRFMKAGSRLLKLALRKVSEREIAQDDGLWFRLALKSLCSFFKNALCSLGVLKEKVARTSQPTELRRRREFDRHICRLDPAKMRLGCAQRQFTALPLAEHGIGFSSMQNGEACEDVTVATGDACRLLCKVTTSASK